MRYGDSGPFSAVRSDPIPRVQAAALSQVIHYSNAVSKVFLRAHVALCIIGLPADDLKVTNRLSVSMVNRHINATERLLLVILRYLLRIMIILLLRPEIEPYTCNH